MTSNQLEDASIHNTNQGKCRPTKNAILGNIRKGRVKGSEIKYMGLKKIFRTAGGVGILGMALPLLASAQGSGVTQPVSPPSVNFNINSVIGLLNNIVTWVFTLFLIIAVIFILIAAFRYLFSGGEAGKVKEATRAVVYAAVAIAVALLSVSIRFIVGSLLGV